MRYVKISFLVLLSLAFIIIGFYSYSIYKFSHDINDPSDDYPKWEGKERVNILLLGVDLRTALRPDETPRSDSILVVSIDPVTKKSQLFSIMRDTYVAIPGHGEQRVNAAYAYGGAKLAMKTISDFTGLNIQYYVQTDFQGFASLVDAIGGIQIDVEKDMKYTDAADNHDYDIDLKKGLQRLDGNKALQYVRFRHDNLSDYARTERQRKFLKAVVQELQSTSSIFKLPKILNAVDPYIKTNFDLTTMLKLGSLGFELKTEQLTSAQLPPTYLIQDKVINGAQVISYDKSNLAKYITDLLAGNIDSEGNPLPSEQPTPTPTPASK